MIRRYAPRALYLTFLASLLYVYASVLGGCGAGALGAHAAGADLVRKLNNEAVVLIDTTCRQKTLAAANNPDATPDEAAVDAAEVIHTCDTIEDAQHLFAAAHGLWVGLLLQAIKDGGFTLEASFPLLIDTLRLYGALVTLTANFDLELPEVPALVSGLLGDD